MKYVAIIFSLVLLTACSDKGTQTQKDVERCATAFAEAFYNYDLNAAGKLTTAEASRLLTFIGTNITQEDIDLLNGQSEGASIQMDDCRQLNDTLWKARLTVRHFMEMDSIGCPMQLRDHGESELTIVKRDGDWLVKTVKTAYPRRSGTHSHD